MAEWHSRKALEITQINDTLGRFILSQICLYIGYNNEPATIGLRSLATATNASKNTVDRRIKSIVESGELIARKEGKSISYSLPFDMENKIKDNRPNRPTIVPQSSQILSQSSQILSQVSQILSQVSQSTLVIGTEDIRIKNKDIKSVKNARANGHAEEVIDYILEKNEELYDRLAPNDTHQPSGNSRTFNDYEPQTDIQAIYGDQDPTRAEVLKLMCDILAKVTMNTNASAIEQAAMKLLDLSITPLQVVEVFGNEQLREDYRMAGKSYWYTDWYGVSGELPKLGHITGHTTRILDEIKRGVHNKKQQPTDNVHAIIALFKNRIGNPYNQKYKQALESNETAFWVFQQYRGWGDGLTGTEIEIKVRDILKSKEGAR